MILLCKNYIRFSIPLFPIQVCTENDTFVTQSVRLIAQVI